MRYFLPSPARPEDSTVAGGPHRRTGSSGSSSNPPSFVSSQFLEDYYAATPLFWRPCVPLKSQGTQGKKPLIFHAPASVTTNLRVGRGEWVSIYRCDPSKTPHAGRQGRNAVAPYGRSPTVQPPRQQWGKPPKVPCQPVRGLCLEATWTAVSPTPAQPRGKEDMYDVGTPAIVRVWATGRAIRCRRCRRGGPFGWLVPLARC